MHQIYLWHVLVLYILSKTIIVDYIQGVNLFWLFLFLGGGITLIVSYLLSSTFITWVSTVNSGKLGSWLHDLNSRKGGWPFSAVRSFGRRRYLHKRGV